MEILSVKVAKALDEYMVNKIGIQSIVLMENAAQQMTDKMVNKGEKFLFFCGTGNNGGDGLVIARKLVLEGKPVKVYIVGNIDKCSNEFKINYEILINLMVNIEVLNDENIESIGSEMSEVDVVVDAIFGIGLNRKIEGMIHKLIDLINKFSKYIISIDNPSGLNCDTGNPLNIAIRADETLVVEVLKKGYFNLGAKNHLGKITVVKIGIPKSIKESHSEKVVLLEEAEYKNMIPVRDLYGHKGSYGKVLILAGSSGFSGAAYLVTEAAVRTGAGLVTLVVEKEIQQVLASKLIESMTVCYEEKEKVDRLINEADVIICGPGIGNGSKNKEMLKKIIFKSKCPILLDADGINIASEDYDLIKKLRGRAVLTPHPGEMSRLTKKSIDYIESNRIDVCRQYSKEHGIVTVLKGYNTIISDGDSVIVNNTGNSKMASGGMGDCLSGIIGALMAQGIDIFNSAKLGCYLHGITGDIIGKERYVVNARDIIEEIPKIMQYILTK